MSAVSMPRSTSLTRLAFCWAAAPDSRIQPDSLATAGNISRYGMTVGLSARLRRDQQIGRVFVGANRFFGLPLRSNLFLSRGREEIGSTDKTVSDVTEISAEQTYRLRRFVDVRYGYALGRNRSTYDRSSSTTALTSIARRL